MRWNNDWGRYELGVHGGRRNRRDRLLVRVLVSDYSGAVTMQEWQKIVFGMMLAMLVSFLALMVQRLIYLTSAIYELEAVVSVANERIAARNLILDRMDERLHELELNKHMLHEHE